MPKVDYLGRVLDARYRVSRLLGESIMGPVYLGENVTNGSSVAVRFLRAGSTAARKESITRFFRAARAAVELRHKNIIKVFDVGVSDEGDPYIITEYLEGESLSDLLLRVGKLKTSHALVIVEPILRAIGAMHRKGILHRGIKPESIYLMHRQGSMPMVKLIDFGLSKFTDSDEGSNLTVVGVTLGDNTYIPPEQIKDSSTVDRRADLYAVGTILYEMLTGDLPFSHLPEDKRLAAKMTTNPIPPRQLVRSIPPILDALIIKSLSKDRNARPSSADEMLNILEGLKGYKYRGSMLNKFTAGPSRLTIAGGNFEAPINEEIASKRANEQRGKRRGIKQASQWLVRTLYGRLVIVAVVVLGVIISVIVALSDDEEEKNAQETVERTRAADNTIPPPDDSSGKEVQIEVRGLPNGAKIYYDDAPIPANPFRVTMKEVIVPLKIEADGYEDYTLSLVPAEDQVVKVEMNKSEPASAGGTELPIDEASMETPRQDSVVEHAPKTEKTRPTSKRSADSSKQENKRDGEFMKLKEGVRVSGEFE